MITESKIKSRLLLAKAVTETIENTGIIDDLQRNYKIGRRGYDKHAMLRSYVLGFIMGHRYVNDLVRLLHENDEAKKLCGFDEIPDRTTFNRFIAKMDLNSVVLDFASGRLIGMIKTIAPALGDMVAVDSTNVNTYANYMKKKDSFASWGAKTSTKTKNGVRTEWFYGYKAHLLADVKYGIPLKIIISSGSKHDTPYLCDLFESMFNLYDWFNPKYLMADRAYDSNDNFEYLWDRGISPVIKVRNMTRGNLIQGVYDHNGIPHCLSGQPMRLNGGGPGRIYHYVCNVSVCRITDPRIGEPLPCRAEHRVNPHDNIKLFGHPSRASKAWRDLYKKRAGIERIFKTMKQNHRLEWHTVKGLFPIMLHVKMSMLVYLAVWVVNRRKNEPTAPTWMVPRIP